MYDFHRVEVAETLCHLQELLGTSGFKHVRVLGSPHQVIDVCVPVALEVVQDSPVLHPRRHHAKVRREAFTVEADQR